MRLIWYEPTLNGTTRRMEFPFLIWMLGKKGGKEEAEAIVSMIKILQHWQEVLEVPEKDRTTLYDVIGVVCDHVCIAPNGMTGWFARLRKGDYCRRKGMEEVDEEYKEPFFGGCDDHVVRSK